MPADITAIKVLIWDFDCTLFPYSEALNQELLEADYKVVMHHTGWSREKTVKEFHRVYLVETPSSTKAAAKLSGISIQEAAIECEEYKDRRKYLSRDPKLIALFASLSRYTHYMLANGSKPKIIQSLDVLGVPPTTFTEIVTAETVGVTKPDPKGFLYILEKTGLPARAHMMIGDRERVDLLPAKNAGMQTCLVWSDTPSKVADVTVPAVYDIAGMLG